MRRGLGIAAAVLLAGCGWTLPAPDVSRDARGADVGADARRDGTTAQDTVVPDDGVVVLDVPVERDIPSTPDAGFDAGRSDAGFDAAAPDVGADVPARDVGDDSPVAIDLGAADVPVAVDVGVDAGAAACAPGERRSCYPGPPASRGRGYCRDGVETCDPGGRWGGACVNAFVPDCADRRCGSDDCGGTCGTACAAGQVCDDLGRCAVPSCGAGNFTETCADSSLCPSNSNCTVDNRCACRPGYVGRTCAGLDCGTSCTYPNWYCARAAFCGSGAISCPGGITCPRHSTCSDGRCVCAFGFMAVTCAGDRCTSCPGTDYRCVPVS